MSFRDIRRAQSAVWPAVQASVERHRASRNALRDVPIQDRTVAASARARVPWNRVVANETVWALAKADLLALPEQAAVVQAARAWAASWEGDLSEMDAELDRPLYDAVQALATAGEVADVEELTLAAE